jgi:hypothetical protein
LAALVAIYFRSRGGPRRGPLVYSFQWDRNNSHAGLLVGESLKQHGVQYLALSSEFSDRIALKVI